MNLSDRFKASLEAFVTRLTAKYDLAALYECTVVTQNGDGSLDLRPDNQSIPGQSNVPIRYGIPGVQATVASGGRALLGWSACDPSKPFALVFDPATLTSLTITAASKVVVNAPDVELGGAGGQPIARQGDAVTVILQPFSIAGTCQTPSGAGTVTAPLVPTAVSGVIAMGSGVAKSQ